MAKKNKNMFDDLAIGERLTIWRNGRQITFERVHAFGRRKNLKAKIICNEPAGPVADQIDEALAALEDRPAKQRRRE
ncbi:MAG: hypothetical protein Q6370_013580 [Candidatus Sigynarchaeota archaeon]